MMSTNLSEHGAADDGDAADAEVRPGEQLAGVVGVQRAELDDEFESRAFGLQIANAATDEARADVVADRLAQNQARLDELTERRSDLTAQRERGAISAGEYRARMASLAVESGSIERSANQSAAVAGELPPALRDAHGIDQTAIETLRTDASQLRGDAAGLAGGIAGERVGAPGGPDRTGERSGPADMSSITDRFTDVDRSGGNDGPDPLEGSV